MVAILQFLLFIVIIGVIIIGVVVYTVYHSLHRTAQKLKEQMGMGGQQQKNGGRPDSSFNRQTTTETGETIIDTRDAETINQKIFQKGEGEYVEFREEGNAKD